MTTETAARSKQTEETLQAICESLKMGLPFDRSCKLAGISKQTGHTWRNSGWSLIEGTPEDSEAPLSFTVRFAVEVEAALRDFMAPLIERIRQGGSGKDKGDWRAAAALLAARFPDEFSEKTHVAKSQRLEVSGELAVKHAHEFQHYLSLRNMSHAELMYEIEKTQSQIDHRPLKGEELDAEIDFYEAKLDAMREARGTRLGFIRSNWLNGPMNKRPITIDLEVTEFSDADTLPAPTETPAPGLVHRGAGVSPLEIAAPVSSFPGASEDAGAVSDATAPATPRVQTGFGFDADTGLAIPLYADDYDEDVVL